MGHTLDRPIPQSVGTTCDLTLPNRMWQDDRISPTDYVMLYGKGKDILQCNQGLISYF